MWQPQVHNLTLNLNHNLKNTGSKATYFLVVGDYGDAMESSHTAGTPGTPSEKPEPKQTLAFMVRQTRKELKSIDEKREALQNEIKASWAAISKAQSDYWVQEANAFDEFVKKGGENNFNNWCSKFARKEARRAKEVAKQQSDTRSQIGRLKEGLTRLDDEYWSKWNACLEAIGGRPSRKTPSREAKSTSPSGPSGIRKTRSKAAVSSPRQPTSKAGLQKALGRLVLSSPSSSPVAAPIDREEKRTPEPARGVTNPVPQGSTPKEISNPRPGQIYQAFYHHKLSSEKGWYLGTPLPWNGEEWKNEIKLDFTMSQMDLMPDFPECYIPKVVSAEKKDEQGNSVLAETITGIEGWAQGFEDGGPREKDRRVLFLFFDDRSKRPGKLNIPKKATSTIKFSKGGLAALPIDWVATKDLRPADVNDEAVLRGRATAAKFKRFMDKIQQPGAPRGLRGAMAEELKSEAGGDTTGFSANSSSAVSPPTPSQDIASKDENISDSDPSIIAAGLGHYGGRQRQGDPDPFILAQDKMDVDDEYGEAVTIGRNQTTSAAVEDPEEFDEGLGMDYDLDFGKAKFQHSPAQSSPARDGHQESTREIPTAEPSNLPRQRQPSPALPHLVGSSLEAQHVTPPDSSRQSQDALAASDDFQKRRD